MSRPTVSIVVPTFRRPAALREALVALTVLDYEPQRYELIVVDDGDDATTAGIIGDFRAPETRIVLESQRCQGAASARNAGAQRAGGELLLFVDDDIVVAPDHLLRHCDAHAAHPGALVNGAWEFAPAVLEQLRRTPFGRYRIELERRFQDQASGQLLPDGCVEMDLLGSWDLSLPRQLFLDLGGFDGSFPGAGAEDQDLSLRAKAAGRMLLLDRRIRCLHNDNRVTLRSYCAREERSAQTMPLLARKYPARFADTAYVRENRPLDRADTPSLVAKKMLKAALANRPALDALHRAADLLEAVGIPESALRRLYSGLLGLHLFRGFRLAWSA